MSGRIQYEVWLMALSLVTGAWLMLAYDTLRVFRLVIRHGSFWMGVEDFIYWLYAGLVTFILYDRFISRIFFKCLKKIGKCLKIIFNRGRHTKICNQEQSEVGE